MLREASEKLKVVVVNEALSVYGVQFLMSVCFERFYEFESGFAVLDERVHASYLDPGTAKGTIYYLTSHTRFRT